MLIYKYLYTCFYNAVVLKDRDLFILSPIYLAVWYWVNIYLLCAHRRSKDTLGSSVQGQEDYHVHHMHIHPAKGTFLFVLWIIKMYSMLSSFFTSWSLGSVALQVVILVTNFSWCQTFLSRSCLGLPWIQAASQWLAWSIERGLWGLPILGHKNSCSSVLELWEHSWSLELPCKKVQLPWDHRAWENTWRVSEITWTEISDQPPKHL